MLTKPLKNNNLANLRLKYSFFVNSVKNAYSTDWKKPWCAEIYVFVYKIHTYEQMWKSIN